MNTNFKVLDLPFLYKVLFFFCASKQPQTNPKISSILVLKHWFLLLVQNTYIFTNMHTMKEWVSNFKGFHIQSDSLVGVLKEGTALCIICPEEKKNNLERLFPPTLRAWNTLHLKTAILASLSTAWTLCLF